MAHTLVIDASAITRLLSCSAFSEDWFRTFSEAQLPNNVGHIQVGEIVFLLGPDAIRAPRLLVISLSGTGLFDALEKENRNDVFSRILQVAADKTPNVGPGWAQFRAGSKLSFQSVSWAKLKDPPRIEMDLNPRGHRHAYVYALDRTHRRLETVLVPYQPFDDALQDYDDAALRRSDWVPQHDGNPNDGFLLTAVDDPVSLGLRRKDWLRGRLTSEQQRFITQPLQQSLRLFGAAGTGKTLSLVLKCALDATARLPAQPDYRILFLTHSQATVTNVTEALYAVDDNGVIAAAAPGALTVCTLLELAYKAMRYDLHQVSPLSTDGLEGRKLQCEVLEGQIARFRDAEWIAYRDQCSAQFQSAIDADYASAESRAFVAALLMEINCVLEAEGVRDNQQRRTRYESDSKGRKRWMMPLPADGDRRAVLRLYDMFRQYLRELQVIGVGEMITDYLGFLDTHLWNQARLAEGWDVIFIDELHLFNHQERMVPHYLMKRGGQQLLVMAYDNKQSVQDTFYAPQSNAAFPSHIGAGQTVPFELKTGFRYTPAIAEVLEAIDETFPNVIDFEPGDSDGWRPIRQLSRGGDRGQRPVLHVALTDLELFNQAFSTAKVMQQDLQAPKRVAVLCLNEAMFERYSQAGQVRDDLFVVRDREDISRIRYLGHSKYIFSMPEFVAGEQFDTVVLIHVNEGDVEHGVYGPAAFRRYVSAVYLGASRAERKLRIFSSLQRGGYSRVLQPAIDKKVLVVQPRT